MLRKTTTFVKPSILKASLFGINSTLNLRYLSHRPQPEYKENDKAPHQVTLGDIAPILSLPQIPRHNQSNNNDSQEKQNCADTNGKYQHKDDDNQADSSVTRTTGSFIFAANVIGVLLGSAVLSLFVYILYKANQQHEEKKIIGNKIDALSCDYEIKNDTFCNGRFSNQAITLGNQTWLRKGASDRVSFLREFIIATALNILSPTSQPSSGIFHEPIPNSNMAIYRTMSEIKPNSMDLEDFIQKYDWKTLISKKPMVSFDVALAMIGMIAGQQDCKFANMIITEYDDHFEVGVIDFELCGTSMVGKIFNHYAYTTDPERLVHYIRELHSPDAEFSNENNKLPLSGDPRAKEFVDYALSHFMKEENIINFYREVMQTDFISPTISRLELLRELNTGLVRPWEMMTWERELKKWQTNVAQLVETYDNKNKKIVNKF